MNDPLILKAPGRGRWRWPIAVGILAGMLALALIGHFRTTPAPAPERTAQDLVSREGALCARDTGLPYTGWLVDRFSSGSLRSRSWLARGVLHGISEGWHTNGVLQIQEQFANGIADGPVIRWREDGSKMSEGAAQAGKLEGLFQRWHANGQLSEEVTLRSGQPHGKSRSWYPNGSLRAEVQLEKGQVLSQRFWKEGERMEERGTPLALSSP